MVFETISGAERQDGRDGGREKAGAVGRDEMEEETDGVALGQRRP